MFCSQPSTDILPPGSFIHLRHSVQKQNDGSSPEDSDFSTVFARRCQYNSLNIIMKAAFYITQTNTHLNWTLNPWTHRGLDLALIHQGMDTGPLRVSHDAWRLHGLYLVRHIPWMLMNLDPGDLETRSKPSVFIHVPRPFSVFVVCRGALSCSGGALPLGRGTAFGECHCQWRGVLCLQDCLDCWCMSSGIAMNARTLFSSRTVHHKKDSQCY